MIHSSSVKKDSVSPQRRRVLQGLGAVTAASIATPVLSSDAQRQARITLSGIAISKLDSPVKSLILRNHSKQQLVISHFSNGALMFDGEILDCGGVCVEKSLTIPAGEETEIRFDKRKLFNSSKTSETIINVIADVQRLNDGTRVVPFHGVVEKGVVTLSAPAENVVS